jgi:predicted permease
VSELFTAVLPVFLLVFLGAACRMLAPGTASWEHGLNQYGMYVAFPALIVNGLLNVRGSLAIDSEIYLLNIAVLLLLIAVPYGVTRLLNTETSLANTYIICIFFGNIGYLGFPIITRLLGTDSALFPAAMLETSMALHISLYNIILFSLGLFILERSRGTNGAKKISRAIATNPLLLSVVAGILIALGDIALPEAVEEMISIISQSATAVVLFGLGLFLPDVRFGKKTLGHVLALSGIGLLLVPLVFMAANVLFEPQREFHVSILEGAMPLAVSPFVLATTYPLRKAIIAGAILISTALSVVTVPLILHLIS